MISGFYLQHPRPPLHWSRTQTSSKPEWFISGGPFPLDTQREGTAKQLSHAQCHVHWGVLKSLFQLLLYDQI